MSDVVKTRIIQIGDSCGIRIPQPLEDQFQVGDEVELTVESREVMIRPVRHPRHGWDEHFKTMAQCGDDHLLDVTVPSLTQWDEDEWEWT